MKRIPFRTGQRVRIAELSGIDSGISWQVKQGRYTLVNEVENF